MKFLPAQISFFFQSRTTRKNIRRLVKFFLLLSVLIVLYSILFHVIMEYEEREFTWVTGLYWTLTVMSTLGFGDITFTSDLGRVFSIAVLLSGIILLLVMLPFTFIHFFYAPWLEAQSRARIPRELPPETRGHVILTNFDPVSETLVEKLKQGGRPYVIVSDSFQRAIELYEQGYNVVRGDLDDPKSYELLRVQNAAMVVNSGEDMVNTSISFTVRELTTQVPIVSNVDEDESVDILQLAGSTFTFQFMKMLGQALARRTLGASMGANVIGRFDNLLIAEAPAMRTPLEGQTLLESGLRETTGVTVIGIWERGRFEIPRAHNRINSTTVLVLAGLPEQLNAYEKRYGVYLKTDAPVLILGGGRVGHAASEVLRESGIDFRIVDKNPVACEHCDQAILGSAADINTLKRAGINEAPSVIITTHDDVMNIYLTIYCRRLREDIQIVSRANLDRNVSTLHRAGADLVMSYSSISANTIMNLLQPDEVLMLAEGMNVFRVPVGVSLSGVSLAEAQIRRHTGCNVIAIKSEGVQIINPDPSTRLKAGDELVMIGVSKDKWLESSRVK
ncbi:MAG: NAD-binding protein [Syntrophobacteraceae bacterium]|nr:NAD-binding protein [Syntrophobacteraceae bacterium]